MKAIYFILSGLLISCISGCSKYLDINSDPATPQIADAKALTPPIFAAMERGIFYDARYIGPLIQNWGYYTAGYWAEAHGWTAGSDVTGEIWRQNYYGLGNNLNMIIENGEEIQQYNYVGLAKAVQAWSWQMTTDMYGDIILTEAFDDSRYVFDYDTQDLVYDHVVTLANEALEYLTRTDGVGSESSLGESDLVYNGSTDKWVKFTYGLLARNANNISNKAEYNPDKVIEYVDKSLSSNDDNFIVPNDGETTVDANFFGPMRSNLTYLRQSSLIVNLLNGTLLNPAADTIIDPRMSIMVTASPDGQYRGVNVAAGDPGRSSTTSIAIANPWGGVGVTNPGQGNGKYLFKDDAGYPIMTYAEMQFLKSEAAWHKGNLATAYEAYKNGILASIDFVSNLADTKITSDQINEYMSSASVAQSAASLTLKDIMLQKYLALWGYGFMETWVDLRRYHYIEGGINDENPYLNAYFYPSSFYSDNNGLPAYRYRPRYNSEYIWNVEALSKIGADQPDYHTYEMWFSKSN